MPQTNCIPEGNVVPPPPQQNQYYSSTNDYGDFEFVSLCLFNILFLEIVYIFILKWFFTLDFKIILIILNSIVLNILIWRHHPNCRRMV